MTTCLSPSVGIVLTDHTLIQPGDIQPLRFNFPQRGVVEVAHPIVLKLRLTALSQGCVVDPQPTVMDRLLTLTWEDPAAGPFFAAYDAAHQVYMAEVPEGTDCYGEITISVAAPTDFAVTRPYTNDPQVIDAIEIIARLEARVQPPVPVALALSTPGVTDALAVADEAADAATDAACTATDAAISANAASASANEAAVSAWRAVEAARHVIDKTLSGNPIETES
jgi:hypothetical protein